MISVHLWSRQLEFVSIPSRKQRNVTVNHQENKEMVQVNFIDWDTYGYISVYLVKQCVLWPGRGGKKLLLWVTWKCVCPAKEQREAAFNVTAAMKAAETLHGG